VGTDRLDLSLIRKIGGRSPPYETTEADVVSFGVPRVVLNPCRKPLPTHGSRRRNLWHPSPTMGDPVVDYRTD
jgi:hypothetical protein